MEHPMTGHPVHDEPTVAEPHAPLIQYSWPLGEITDDHGRTGTAIAELVISHRPDTKAFTAFLRPGVRHRSGGTSFCYRLDQPSWSMSQPIVRYSRPRLAAFAARALAALRDADPTAIAYAFDAPGADA
jgi:hypothetical protein